MCVGKDSAMVFLFDILDEVTELFPSKYLNIGGDEAVYTRWKECERCLALMEREGLSEVSQLQGWLTDTVARVMANKDVKVIGWEEIITRGDVSTPVVALTWHNVADTIIPKSKGHQSILTPATHTYFDFPEYDKPGEVQAATWLPPIPIEKVYSMHVNDYSTQSAVIGVQGCLWSDQFIHGTVLQELQPLNENRSETYIDYLTFPRLTALSEVAWTNEKNRSWNDFSDRLYYHYPKLDNKGINYRVPEPLLTDITVNADNTVSFRLEPTVEGSEIRYTVNGTYPTIHSALYDGSVMTVPEGTVFYASTVVNGKRVSLPVMIGQNPE